MMKNGPKFSTATLKYATTLGNAAAKIGVVTGPARNNPEKFGDMLFFMLSNGPDICVIRCTRYAYLVEYYWDAHVGGSDTDYFMIKNIRHFLFYLNKKNFTDFDIWDAKIAESLNEESAELEEDFDFDLDLDDEDFNLDEDV